MLTTSHFIGLKIKSDILVDLYLWLQDIVQDDPSMIEFQNILSAHVTLYYLPAVLSAEILESIRDLITTANIALPVWNIEWLDYFHEENAPRICFLLPSPREELEKLHREFKTTFVEFADMSENSYPIFVPHITLFKVKNVEKFLKKKPVIESLMQEKISRFRGENVFEDIKIYRVNSRFQPEIQIPLTQS